MAVYELRTYQVVVGKMKDAVSAYNNKGWPALQKGNLSYVDLMLLVSRIPALSTYWNNSALRLPLLLD